MQNKNEYLSDSSYFEVDLSLLSQNIENLQKHVEVLLVEGRAAYRREAALRRLKNPVIVGPVHSDSMVFDISE
jgi:hypothetical protein